MADHQPTTQEDVIAMGVTFLEVLFVSGDIIEVRALDPGGDGRDGFADRYFPKSVRDAVEVAHGCDRCGLNGYFGVFPKRTKKGKQGNASVARLTCTFVDIDYTDLGWPAGKDDLAVRLQAGEITLAEVLTRGEVRAREILAGLPPTTIIVDSGAGVHAYWRLAEDLPLDTPEQVARAQRLLAACDETAGGDPNAKDLARILRIPGTTNHPSAKKRRLGRTSVPTRLVRVEPSIRYRLEDLERAFKVEVVPVTNAAPSRKVVVASATVEAQRATAEPPLEIVAWVQAHPRVKRVWDRPGSADLSARDWALACAALQAGADEGLATRILMADPHGKWARDHENGYVVRTVERAVNYIATKLAAVTGTHPSPPAQEGSPAHEYLMSEAGTFRQIARDGETVLVPLANFSARIREEVVVDDGAESRRAFRLEAALAGRTVTFDVAADQFARMDWALPALGARAVIHPGRGVVDQLRAAIQLLSEPTESRVHGSLGWVRVDGAWDYAHAGGLLGADGSIRGPEVVRLPDALARYDLPAPSEGAALIADIQADLRLRELAPALTYVLHTAAVASLVLEPDFGVFVVGPSGAFKSAAVALIQQRWGAALDARHLPASFSSTANSTEFLAFLAADAILVVDDYAPGGSTSDRQRYAKEAERLIRAIGNRAGRGRMRADGSLRATRPPRATVVMTGEDLPPNYSARNRLVVVTVAPGDVNVERLTACQSDATEGAYARANAAMIRWLAPRLDEVRERVRQDAAALRGAIPAGTHRRSPDAVARLGAALRVYLEFVREVGALTDTEATALWERTWPVLTDTVSGQQEHQREQEPAERFLALLRAALVAGRAHVASPEGRPPRIAPERWGWAPREDGSLLPRGDLVGWVDGGDLLLEPQVAYRAVQAFAADGEGLAVSASTLKRRLFEAGALASIHRRGEGRQPELSVRRTLQGAPRSVLHLRVETLDGGGDTRGGTPGGTASPT